MNWKDLSSLDQLDKIDEASKQGPVLIYKHSTRCSVSAATLGRLERKWNDDEAGNMDTYFLDLIAYRDVSNAIAGRYGVEHQSPQVLLIKDGMCVYDTSHFGISFEELVDNLGPVSA